MTRRRSSYYDDYWPRYETSGPIRVEDGIVAKSQRGKFVQNWWADRWIAALNRLMDPRRLSRGRSYARRGQVLEIQLSAGKIGSRVQGSRRTPYRVSIELKPLSDRQWDTVLDALADQALYSAQLLNGEMPSDIEQVFDAVRVPLFPASSGDLVTDCTCPDWANPCKHVAAVYYLMGERFDQDPFLLFDLRGRSKDEVIAGLRERRAQGLEALGEASVPYTPGVIEAVETLALQECLDDYWTLGPQAETVTLNLAPPGVDMALLKRLGVPDFVPAKSFWAQMERVCAGVTERAISVAFEERE